MVQELLAPATGRMEAALAHFQEEIKSVRTGRASSSMVDNVIVSAYGSPLPLKQVATVTTPDASQLQIQPFDQQLIPAIRTSIQEANLGFSASDDGRVLRLSIPPLTAERREEMVKKLGKMAEQARITVRTTRGDIWDAIQKAQKDSLISEDNREWGRAEIDKITAEFNKKIEAIAKDKEVELRTV